MIEKKDYGSSKNLNNGKKWMTIIPNLAKLK